MDFLRSNTPIERHKVKDRIVHVKREDQCTEHPDLPHFGKMRGIVDTLLYLKSVGIKKVAVYDTRISRGGWGVAVICRELELECFDFFPKLSEQKLLPEQQIKARQAGASLIPLEAGPTPRLYIKAQHIAEEQGAYMLPLGLVTKFAVKAVAEEAATVPGELLTGSLVVCVGFGTILSGLVEGLKALPAIHGVAVGLKQGLMTRVFKLLAKRRGDLAVHMRSFIDLYPSPYDYYDKALMIPPWEPCDPHYDRKAYEWMHEHLYKLRDPILFWNIG